MGEAVTIAESGSRVSDGFFPMVEYINEFAAHGGYVDYVAPVGGR